MTSNLARSIVCAALCANLPGCTDPEVMLPLSTDTTATGSTSEDPLPTTTAGNTTTAIPTDPTAMPDDTDTTDTIDDPTVAPTTVMDPTDEVTSRGPDTDTTTGDTTLDTTTGDTTTTTTGDTSLDTTTTTTGDTSLDTTTTTTGDTSTTTTGDTSTTTTGDTETSTTEDLALCGDGELDPGETCDDGNLDADDACSASCQQNIERVVLGSRHTCALFVGGAVKCWGKNHSSGILGLEDEEPRGEEPGDMGDALPIVQLGGSVVEISAGADHTCVRLDDGRVKCWGTNSVAALGLGHIQHIGDDPGEMGDALPAVDLGAGLEVVQISAGYGHTLVLFKDGRIKGWGDAFSGQLGTGSIWSVGNEPGEMGDSLPFIDLGVGVTATQVTAGSSHSCAVLSGGKVKCWGDGMKGQLGLGAKVRYGDQPGEMGDNLPYVDLGTAVKAISLVASNHTCALLSDHRVKCWGPYYNLGLGDKNTRGDEPGEMGDDLPYVDLGTGRTAVALNVGNASTCALLDDGTLKCWGGGFSGVLGQGSTANIGLVPGQMGDNLPPIDLGQGMAPAELALGQEGDHQCATLVDGRLKCWGNNLMGQLGLGDAVYRGNKPGQMGDALPIVKLVNDQW